jgi:GNAT superfamily N-acetyltransferase
MKIVPAKELSVQQKEAVLCIWNEEYSEQLVKTMAGFEKYLSKLGNVQHFLMYDEADAIFGWAVAFDRESERWFAIILDSSVHGKGYGTQLLNVLKEHEPELNGWVTDHDRDVRRNGKPYRSPMGFYLKNGFEVLSDVRLETEELSAVKIRWAKLDNLYKA